MNSLFLPLFPLRLVAFPGEDLNLHIFEPRYKELIQECDEKGITFGLPPFIDDKMQTFGTVDPKVLAEKGKETLKVFPKNIQNFPIQIFAATFNCGM